MLRSSEHGKTRKPSPREKEEKGPRLRIFASPAAQDPAAEALLRQLADLLARPGQLLVHREDLQPGGPHGLRGGDPNKIGRKARKQEQRHLKEKHKTRGC